MTPSATKPRSGCRRMGVLFAGGLLLAGCATTPADVRQWAATGGANAVPQIDLALDSSDAATRQAAVAALITLPDQTVAKKSLMQAMLSPNPVVRGEVGAALVFNSNEDLNLGSISLVADPDAGVRQQMASALAAAGRAGPLVNTDRAGIYLWGLTQDTNPDVRAAAAEGVATLGLNDPIDFALAALRNDAEPRVRAAAARGLGVLARIYLSGQRAPGATEARGEEIVAALMQTAKGDNGQYQQVNIEQSWLFTRRVAEVHWVAAEAAGALTVPGIVARPDVSAAIAAGLAHIPPASSTPLHPFQFNLRGFAQ